MREVITNLSDQVKGYSEEISCAVDHIAKIDKCEKEFALLIVQTAIENMKMDCQHHMIYDGINEIAESIRRIAESIEELKPSPYEENCLSSIDKSLSEISLNTVMISDNLSDGFGNVYDALEESNDTRT